MGRKSNVKQFSTFSELADKKGFYLEFVLLVDKLSKTQKIWEAARRAYYVLMAEHYPHMLRYKPKPLTQKKEGEKK